MFDANKKYVISDVTKLWDKVWYFPKAHSKANTTTWTYLENGQVVNIASRGLGESMLISENGFISQDYENSEIEQAVKEIKTYKIYYAHCMAIYFTPQEERDIKTIQQLYPYAEIYNPNNPVANEECKEIGMGYFLNIVKTCDLVVFRGLPNMKIPSGVWMELNCAEENNIPVIELPCFTGREMSYQDTKQFLKEIGQR